jgi:hypothetical protein
MANRKYVSHGEIRQKKKTYTLVADAAACSTVSLHGGSAELHYVQTASTGCGTGANINLDLNLPRGATGPHWIVYDSNHTCDNTNVDILINGTAVGAQSDITITANDARLIVVNVVDGDAATRLATISAVDDLNGA